MNPPLPVRLELKTSTFHFFSSAYLEYIRNKSFEKSAASSPPVPARISTITFRSSRGSLEVIFNISGKGAYSKLKYEGGTHRVQRVPDTESQGRIHTSAVTVAVLPEVEEVDIKINPADVKVDVYRSSGPGGQSVNTTDSAVRLTYIPTGIVVTCQDEKSQHKNREKAMKVLRARLYDEEQRKQQESMASERKQQVGSGDRSGRIRTYNYPQERITDHRIGLTLHKLSFVMEGDLDEIIDALTLHFQTQALKGE